MDADACRDGAGLPQPVYEAQRMLGMLARMASAVVAAGSGQAHIAGTTTPVPAI